MKIKFFAVLILFLALISCKPGNPQTNFKIKIDVNDKSYYKDLPKLSIESIVTLEFIDSALFGNVCSADFYSDRIYLLDIYNSKSLFVFSEDGSFINKTKLGKGPTEIIDPYAFFVDREKDNILLYDQMLGYIYRYDLGLNFLSKEKYIGVPILDFAKLDDDRTLVRSHFNEDYVFTLYSSDYSIEKKFIKDLKYHGSQGLLKGISKKNKNYMLISSFDYNIYEWDGENIQSEYYFDFGSYKIGKDDIEKRGISGIWKLIKSGERVSSPMGVSESDSFLWFHVIYLNDAISYIYSLKNRKVYCLNGYFESGIIPKCRVLGSLSNDVFYALVEPSDMIDFQKGSPVKLVNSKISITQNPFFMTFNISEAD